MNIIITQNTHSQTYQDALSIRRDVFVEEQHIPETIEIDHLETLCQHVVLYSDDHQPIATTRILPLDETTWKIQRVAVKKAWRGQTMGQQLLQSITDLAYEQGITCLTLNAQQPSIGFYQALGYQTYGEVFSEAGIPHQAMKRLLN
ncbi:GNAT family N-acetyltransferase [Vagococcus zengguangii]|uniref:GNAT family N-acetyltransferase n=1 Tax=Vagococcus zengguangii TaxID=2571750 RepID=A0A4D7CU55_9ENTE|nr:GNAT family N-acetyltransferase [Vagococcus zengguangii]QCI85850.1 GNAT family N-acetyltransferase [Vagococcus zengguangii]TLG81790.1 GNAT family N-acetyltransferase [Vagococcus zengguangii]